MRSSIFHKLFLSYASITLFLSFFIFLFSYNLVKNSYINELKIHLKDTGISLMHNIFEFYKKEDYEYLDKFAKEMGEKINTRITIIDTMGNPLADSKENPRLMENHRDRPEIVAALNGDIGSIIRYSKTLKEEMLYVALPIYENGRVIGVLRTSIFMKDVNSLLSDLRERILILTIGVLIFSWLIAILISKSVTDSLKELLKGFKKLSSFDFETRIFTKRKDEIGDLSREFNEMVKKIKHLFDEVKIDREKISAIFHSILCGICVFDKDGKIILFNEKMKEFLKEDLKENRLYWEYFKSPEFGRLIEKVKKGESVIDEIEMNGKIFVCTMKKVPDTEEIISIFHDITEIREVERIKRDFTINISHELKTPLTVIKGFIETLEEEENIKNKKYIEVIKNHIERLINILERIIYISEIERKEVVLDLKEVKIDEIIKNLLPLFQKSLEDKDIKVELNFEKDLPLLKVDPVKMEQVFINLIDNAIKYTEKGKIKISAFRKDNNIIIEFEDTGIGIPKEHIPRIFERFYVVDKARDKKKGGAGLGLSIVKHIILLHNGKVDVESKLGEGTKFIITLPIP